MTQQNLKYVYFIIIKICFYLTSGQDSVDSCGSSGSEGQGQVSCDWWIPTVLTADWSGAGPVPRDGARRLRRGQDGHRVAVPLRLLRLGVQGEL